VFEVIYYSMCGSTKKIAEAIAGELGVKAEDVKMKKEPTRDSFLFLGSGCYARKPWRKVQDFIARNDFKGRNVALFGVSASGEGDEVTAMEKSLKLKGAIIKGIFYCKGRAFLFLNRGHPSNEELANARKFASEMKQL